MNKRKLALIAGISYIIIFFSAIFANFFALEAMKQEPLATIQGNAIMVRLGTMAFLIAAVFDIVVAWALYELYKKHSLSLPSTYFRMTHAIIMGIAVFALPMALTATSDEAVLRQVDIFNTIWLIGLFFFGVHLVLLGKIIQQPKLIAIFLIIAGVMYMLDTSAHFLLVDYKNYASIFLTLVAIPSIVGEMAFSIWLLAKGGKDDYLTKI